MYPSWILWPKAYDIRVVFFDRPSNRKCGDPAESAAIGYFAAKAGGNVDENGALNGQYCTDMVAVGQEIGKIGGLETQFCPYK